MTQLAYQLLAAWSDDTGHGGFGDRPAERRRAPERANPSAPEERALVQRIRAGDDTALSELFQTHAPGMASFINGYVREPAVAEEIVQDVFLWIVRNRATWSVRSTLRSYLYGAARHHAMDHLKHRAVEHRFAVREAARAGDAVLIGERGVDADAQLLADERVTILSKAIDQLPESRRTALTLRWMHELSYAEIAAILGSSTKAVENQLNRTLRQLRGLVGLE